MQHRFRSGGELHGHAVGNLLIVALWELMGDPVRALEWVGQLLGARGRVLPMAAVPLDIRAEVELDGAIMTVRGQVACALTSGQVRAISLIPPNPPVPPEAIQAIHDADWVVLGPGSWFTSVLPHLKVPELAGALYATRAAVWSSSTWRPSPARQTASPPKSTSRYFVSIPPPLGLTPFLPTSRWRMTRPSWRRPRQPSAAALFWGMCGLPTVLPVTMAPALRWS